MKRKFFCPHCSRVVGRPKSQITEEPSCSLCSKDFLRVRQIVLLAGRVRGVSGTPPEVVGKLFAKWAELTGETMAMEAMTVLMERWATEDAADQAEKEARAR